MSLFNDPEFKEEVCKKLGCKMSKLHELVLPPEGLVFNMSGISWKVTYVKANPMRFSAEPIGMAEVRRPPKKEESKWTKMKRKFLNRPKT